MSKNHKVNHIGKGGVVGGDTWGEVEGEGEEKEEGEKMEGEVEEEEEEEEESQSNKVTGNAFALHTINPGSITGIPYGSLSQQE